MPKKAIDSFMAKSESAQYTSSLIIDTSGAIQRNALRTLGASPKTCRVLDALELDSWDVDWLAYVDDPEYLEFQTCEPYTSHPYQQEAIDKVCVGFETYDRGQLILPCGTGKTAVTLWIAERIVGEGGWVAVPGAVHCPDGADDAGMERTEPVAFALPGHLLRHLSRAQ